MRKCLVVSKKKNSIFAIVKEITIATIGCGSEKPEQAQFSLALHDGCIMRKMAARTRKFALII